LQQVFKIKNDAMKKLVLFVVIGAIVFGTSAIKKSTPRISVTANVPAAVITDSDVCWFASFTNAASYKKMDLLEDDRPVITKIKFRKDGTFSFVYSKINKLQQAQTEIVIEGKVVFTKNKKGKNILATTATNGYCKEIKNNQANEYPVPAKTLDSLYTGSWLWEKIAFPNIPSEDFLLLVDLKAHPAAADGSAGSIDKSWVSKFYMKKLG